MKIAMIGTGLGHEHGVPQRITETVIEVNEAIKRRMIDKILDLCGGGAQVRVCDPREIREGEKLLPGVTWIAPVIADLRNVYDPETARADGFTRYIGMGR